MDPGTRVRLIGDPGRVGTIEAGARVVAGVQRVRVAFSDGPSWVPADQLEPLDQGPSTPQDLFLAGRLGRAIDLRRGLTHVRLTGRLADTIYSMDMTRTDFHAHQFKPVVKLLMSGAAGILIADEVGLGKTIEAGLVWTELRARFDYRRLLVVAPAMLRSKWRMELSHRFGVDAPFADAEALLETLVEAARVPHKGFQFVASQQGLRPRRGYDAPEGPDGAAERLARFLDQRAFEEPLVDLLVIDEAHYMRNRSTQTAELGHLLRRVAQHTLLLSATPIHLGNIDLFNLLHVLDEDTFQSPEQFEQLLQANAPLVQARDLVLSGRASRAQVRDKLRDARGFRFLRDNQQLGELIDAVESAADLRDPAIASELARRLDTVNLLGHVVTRTRKREVTEWRVVRDASPTFVRMAEVERELYEEVTRCVRDYCQRYPAAAGFLLVTPQRQLCSSMPAALRAWHKRVARWDSDEDLGDDGGEQATDARPLVEALVQQLRGLSKYEEVRRSDSKYAHLRDQLRRYLSDHPGEKVVLFSYFRETLAYLSERLRDDGISSIVLQGGAEKDEVLDTFRASNGPSVLLSSEVGSEGVDLQFSRVVINYDLPWNPMKVEQRIGRVDRLGQKAQTISIWSLFYADTIDARIYERLLERLEIFEQSIGDIEPIIGEQIRDLSLYLLRQHLTPEQEAERIDQTARALQNRRRDEEDLERQAVHLVAYGDYIVQQIQAARALSRHISAQDLRAYLNDFLGLYFPGSQFSQRGDDPMEIELQLSNGAKLELDRYLREQRLSLANPLLQAGPVRCRFENTVASTERDGVQLVSQFHSVIRFAAEYAEKRGPQPHAAISARVPAHAGGCVALGVYAFCVQRWSIQGLQDVEKLAYEAARLDDGTPLDPELAESLLAATASAGADWLSAQGEVSMDLAHDRIFECEDRCTRRHTGYATELRTQNDDRANFQLLSLRWHHDRQHERLVAIAEEHRRLGRHSLVKATEARISKLDARIEQRRHDLDAKRTFRHSERVVAVGVIEVVE